ncbi:efflux RND transporter periplasmic adaptor subunit [Parasphingorhabdus sp.]|uniref:efflux RND transporter periplasmic adaptor subunit n=1 Tax=Parasphingorhabdus sp. TaxID=2709688 RepID=UPI003A945D62
MLRKYYVGLLVPLLLLSSCDNATDNRANAEIAVGYVDITQENITLETELSGRVSASVTSEVRPQITGIIQKMLFKEGSVVRAGQPLYQIDSATYRASYNQTSAALKNARIALAAAEAKARRYESLGDIEAVSKQDRDDVLAEARQARAAVELAQANLQSNAINLRYTSIKAPISGRIGASAYTKGALVTASQSEPLATILQLDPIYVTIQQSAAQILRLRKALANGNVFPATADVSIVLEDASVYPIKGQLQFSEPVVDETTGTVTLRATVANPQALLLPGMYVTAVLPEAEVQGAILAPQQGVKRSATGKSTAYVIDKDGKAAKRTLAVDRAIGNKWLVTSGLKAGDKLIVEGLDKIKEGVSLKPVKLKLPEGSGAPTVIENGSNADTKADKK